MALNKAMIEGNELIKEDKWLSFELSEKKAKTNVYDVVSKCSECILGEIKWYPAWRHYCFFPNNLIKTVHSDRCLINIGEFVLELNKQHKKHDIK